MRTNYYEGIISPLSFYFNLKKSPTKKSSMFVYSQNRNFLKPYP